jgi:hypothetical protein
MAKVKLFISFDFDHDEDLRNLLVGQAKNPDSPFEIADYSLKEHLTGDWKAKIRERIKRVEQMCVICGLHTDNATGVSVEVNIAQEENKPYFLLEGHGDKICKRPTAARSSDKMYRWTWENLKLLIGGTR